MKFIGFNFTKINVEKLGPIRAGVNIQTSVDIRGVKETKSDFTKTGLIEVNFSYFIKYDPKVADISFEGIIITEATSKETKEVMKSWKKKDLPEEFKTEIINLVMRKASLKALILEDEMGLPLHFPLPTIKKTQKNLKA